MNLNKSKYSNTKQRGFFTVGVGLVLFAVYGAITTGIVASHDTRQAHEEKLAMQSQPALPSNANH